MSYMLDTNTCVFAIKKDARVLGAFKAHQHEGLFISSIVLSELEYGVSHSQRVEQNRVSLTQLLAIISLVSYNDRAAFEYGVLRADLQQRGCLIGNMDMLIAAHAIATDTVLVTNNTREFSRVRGLQITDWKH